MSEPAAIYSAESQYSAPAFLRSALDIQQERGKQYDAPEGERSMGKTISAFNTITGHTLAESDGWLLLQLLKDVRDRSTATTDQDSLLDCVSYAALKAESRMKGL